MRGFMVFLRMPSATYGLVRSIYLGNKLMQSALDRFLVAIFNFDLNKEI